MPELAIAIAVLCALPLAGALGAALTRGRAADAIALATSGAAALWAVALVAARGREPFAASFGGLPALDRLVGRPVPLFGFAFDPLSGIVLLGAAVIGFVCVLYSMAYVSERNRETPSRGRPRYLAWLLAFIGAMSGLVTSATLFQMFVFWELTTICSWALIGFYDEEHEAPRAALQAFLVTAGGGLCLFGAILALVGLTGSAGFDALARIPGPARGGAAAALFGLMLLGAWTKSAQVPFHGWLPSAMVAPSPVSAYLHAAAMVNAGVYLVLRITLAVPSPALAANALPPAAPGAALAALPPWIASGPPAAAVAPVLPPALAWVLGGMAVITLVLTVAQFFHQRDLKRLLAYSTISHLALVLLGASLAIAGSVRAAQGATLHILAHGVGKALLFLSVGTLSYAAGTRRIGDLTGVLGRAPIAAVGFLVGALTVTGVPPFAGFWSKLLMVTGAVELGGVGFAVAALIVVESAVAFAWFLWVGQKVCLGRPSPAVLGMGRTAPSMDLALLLLMGLCLAITLLGLPLAQSVRPGPFGG